MKKVKKLTPKKDAKLLADVRTHLRAKAPQVKMILIDHRFTGEITCTERKDLGKKGYKVISRTFKSFDELKKYYNGVKNAKPSKGSPRKVRRATGSGRKTIKGLVGKLIRKKRNV